MKVKEIRTSNINNSVWGNKEVEMAIITKQTKGFYMDCMDYDLSFPTLKELKAYLRKERFQFIGWEN